MTDVWFSPAVRHGGAPFMGAHGRAVQDQTLGIDTAGPVFGGQVRLRFAVQGVADVRGLQPGAVVRRVPHPGTFAAEEEQRPYVEFAAADLPWRYSPGPDSQGRVRPWLMLVVAGSGDLEVVGDRATLRAPVLAGHDPAEAALWAHVQRAAAGGDPAVGVARVLCARRFAAGDTLEPDHDHTAALVVPWNADGSPAWGLDGAGPVDVLCLDSWHFRTGPAGGFKDLALELAPGDNDPLGAVEVLLDDGTTLAVPGALTTQLPDDDPAQGLQFALLERESLDGRMVVGPPAYGAPWLGYDRVRSRTASAQAVAPAHWRWPEQLNADLGRRVVAAVGRQAAVDLQEEIVGSAARVWRAGPAASSMLSGLALGLAASSAMWRRRLPADPVARAAVLGPAMGRIPTEGADGADGPTLRDSVARPERDDRQGYPVSLLGPVGRRALRAGGTVTHLALPGAARPDLIAVAATRSEVVPDRPQEALAGGADPADIDPAHLDTLAHDAAQEVGEAGAAEAAEVFARTCGMHGPDPHPGPERVGRRPVDLSGLGGLLVDVLDPGAPHPPARGRVTVRIDGIDPRRALQPLEDCPDLDLPAWRYLRDRAQYWLLPGAQTLSSGEVVSLRTNPQFVEQFLAGFNQQALAELHWRGHPVRAGCTPLRRFWDRTPTGAGGRRDDIAGVAGWIDAGGVPTGRAGEHPPAGVVPERLVVVIRSELFRRYPATLVSLAPGATPGLADRPANLAAREWPEFIAALSADLTMFAFRTDPVLTAQRWVVVEEVPEGIRFTTQIPPPAGAGADGATTAAALLMKPVRVLLNGAETIP
jgi:hypothetical protein